MSAVGCGRERERGRVVRFKPDLKQIPNSNVSNKTQTASNFGRLEKYFLEKLKKYGFEDLGEMNNFLHSNFPIFLMVCEEKFREASMG
jgi:hypothetical protein